jgi:hypothetical protein
MKAANPSSAQWLNYWWHGDSRVPKNLFSDGLCFWFVLLLCRLLRRDLGELVSMMEHNPGYSMKTLHELCESWFCEGIGKKISWERKGENGRNIYNVG